MTRTLEEEIAYRRECAEYVVRTMIGLSDVAVLTLSQEPSREVWFESMLRNLDYEISGGTEDEPRWAWQEHPWFAALGLTDDECYEAFRVWNEAEARR
jgi:hypothetical protein